MRYVLIVLLIFAHPVIFAQTITTIAGNGLIGFSGEGGLAVDAQFNYLGGITSDKFGNIYVADLGNLVIQKIDTNGILTRFAGSGSYGFSGDGGQATAAQLELNVVVGMTVDSIGNLFFSDGNRIRAINGSGIIRTIAGTGIVGDSGENGPATLAKLASPVGLCFDKNGNLYVADQENSKIKKIAPTGIITIAAGDGTMGFGGDGGSVTLAHLAWPSGIAIDDSNNIFIADFNNLHIRKISSSGIINTIAGVDKSSFGPEVCISCAALSIELGGLTVLL